jgi:toxin ParE1/3/4
MHLRYASAVRWELLEIGNFIAADNPARATTFVAELIAKVAQIARTPAIYRKRDDIAAGVRMASHGKYVILFRQTTDAVEVLHIVHGARDLKTLFET